MGFYLNKNLALMSLGLIKLSAATVASWVVSRYLVTDLIGQQWCSFLLVGILAMVPFVSFLSHSLSMMFCTLNAIYNLKVKGKRIGLMDKQFVHGCLSLCFSSCCCGSCCYYRC